MKTAELTEGRYKCKTCNGAGRDEAATKKARVSSGYIMCRPCQGNGLDAAEFFRWSDAPKLNTEFKQVEDGTH